MVETSVGSRVSGASLDVLTSISCVAYWAGIWSLLNTFHVHKIASGLVAQAFVFILALVSAEQWLETKAKGLSPVVGAVLVWVWTCLLAVLSLMIWRLGFFVVDRQVFDPDDLETNAKLLGTPGKLQMMNIHCILLAALGAAVLIATKRFRSASHAPPIGIATDIDMPVNDVEGRFKPAGYSGSKIQNALLDCVLTVPVVFVWLGIWEIFDNFNVDPLWSGIACSAVVFLCAVCDIDTHLRTAFDGMSPMAHNIGDVAFTSILVVLVVGVWRGLWEVLELYLELTNHPHIAATVALLGAVGLTCMKRHRSVIFPPVDFSIDDGAHFASVGHTEPEIKTSLDAETTGYNSTT